MSVDYQRRTVERLRDEIARLEGKVATALDGAATARAAAFRDQSSASKTSSEAGAASYLQRAERHQERAIQHDKGAADAQAQLATKRRSLNHAERRLTTAETAQARRQRHERPLVDTHSSSIDDSQLAWADEDGDSVMPTRGVQPSDTRVDVTRLPVDTLSDAGLELAKAAAIGALGAIPLIGPVLSEMVGTAWGQLRAERLERFAVALGRDVEALQGRLDREFVKQRDFEALAEESIERAVQRRNEQKIPSFAAAVAHSATIDRPGTLARERFLDWLDQLRPRQIALLRRLAEPDDSWQRPVDVITVGQVAQSRLSHALRGLDADQYDWQELERRGLVHSTDDTPTLLAAAGDHRALVTDQGTSFLRFITSELASLTEADIGQSHAGPGSDLDG